MKYDYTSFKASMIDILGEIDARLNSYSMRFALIVWCDRCDQPLYVGSNDPEAKTATLMVQKAIEVMNNVEPQFIPTEVAGNA